MDVLLVLVRQRLINRVQTLLSCQDKHVHRFFEVGNELMFNHEADVSNGTDPVVLHLDLNVGV